MGGSATSAETIAIASGTTFQSIATADTDARGGTCAAKNYGAATTLDTKNETADFTREGLLKFSLSSLHDAASTTLVLSCNVVGVVTFANTATQCASAWTETTLNWNNRPAIVGSTLGRWTCTANTELRIDVTAAVQAGVVGVDMDGVWLNSRGDGGHGNKPLARRQGGRTTSRPPRALLD